MSRPVATTANSPVRPGHATLRNRHLAVRVNTRVLGLIAITSAALLVLMIWAMTLGSLHIPFDDVVRALFGKASGGQELAVRTLRLPRVLTAVLIGMSLAMAGGIFQGMVRNPLVSPDIIGIDAGASLVAVFWIVTSQDESLLPLAAFIGAVTTATAIYLLSWKGGIAPHRLILVGIGISAALSSLTTLMVVRFPIEIVRPAQVWLVGSLYKSNWTDVRVLLASVCIGLPLALYLTGPLRVMQMGDHVSRSLGVRLESTRLTMILVGCGLAAVAVSVAGPIGFVALMIPHMARMIAGPISPSVLAFMAVLGGFFLLLADVIGQHLLPVDMPVGVITGVVGAPYFLYLLYRSSTRL